MTKHLDQFRRNRFDNTLKIAQELLRAIANIPGDTLLPASFTKTVLSAGQKINEYESEQHKARVADVEEARQE